MQNLVNQWLAEAEKLRAEADMLRANGMLESARGKRLKAEQLLDCAKQLQAQL